jgi:mersacidin/lichenicidin family type 2 lantibiotic
MSSANIIRAWKEEAYRLGLGEAERAQLPAHPAGTVELKANELDSLAGAQGGYALEAREACLFTTQCGPSIALGPVDCPYCV